VSVSNPARRGRWPFADVRAGEWQIVLLLALNACLLLAGYYLLKTVREPLILVGAGGSFGGVARLSGPELKTYATAVQALLLLAIVPAYGKLASRVGRLPLVTCTIGAIVASLVAFAVLANQGVPIGIPYYLWLGVASLIGVAQLWSLANDLYSRPDGERLFPLIAIGGTLGAILGAQLAHWLIGSQPIPRVLMIAAGLLALYLAGHSLVERVRNSTRNGRASPPAPLGREGGLHLILRKPYLFLVGAMVACGNLVNTQGEFIFARAVGAHAESAVPDVAAAVDRNGAQAEGAPDATGRAGRVTDGATRDARRVVVGQVYARFYSAVNLLALVLQAFAVSLVIRRLGVHRAVFVAPVVALVAYGGIAALPVFALVRVAKTTENGTDYSLQNTVRHALFLPTSREAKYKAKAAIDSLFFRFGDLAAAGLVMTGVHLFHLPMRGFALLNLAVTVIWIAISVAISSRYRSLSAALQPT
jgi:AAA family ATP:ADP antiporter